MKREGHSVSSFPHNSMQAMIEELDEDNSGDIDLKEFLKGFSTCRTTT